MESTRTDNWIGKHDVRADVSDSDRTSKDEGSTLPAFLLAEMCFRLAELVLWV